MTADEALAAWRELNYGERCYATGVLAWNNPDAMIAAATAAKSATTIDHTPDDE